jgi:streptomycin 6-kinase
LQPSSSYLLQWGLTDPQLLADTATSVVYKVRRDGRDAVLKILNRTGTLDEAGGAVALRYFDGVGAVRLLDHDAGAQLLEYAGGADLVSLVTAGHDAWATDIIVDVLNRLHQPRPDRPIAGLTPLAHRFASLFRHATTSEDPLFKRAAAIAERLLGSQTFQCVLHGDIHQENIRHAGERGWLAIDPKGLYGERTFDAVNVLLNPRRPHIVLNEARFARTVRILADGMQIDTARLLEFAFAFACLSAAWSIEDGQDPSSALAIARIAEQSLFL